MSDKSVTTGHCSKENDRIPGSKRWMIAVAIVYLAWLVWLLYVGWNHSAR